MQIKIYTIPIIDSDAYVEEMNLFLRSHRVVDIRKELVQNEHIAYWSFCITYLLGNSSSGQGEKKERIDYKQVLDELTFARFSTLREIRKQIANNDAVPAYSVFTDAELAEFAKIDVLTPAALKKVEGVGEKRMEKYGLQLIELYEKKGQPDSTNSGVGQPAGSLF